MIYLAAIRQCTIENKFNIIKCDMGNLFNISICATKL